MAHPPIKTPAQAPASANTRVAQLSFAFPFLKRGQTADGKGIPFADEHDIYRLLAEHEPGGFYLVSPSGMWHGGIHVTEAGAGQSLDLDSGVRCIADGEVVAYRINKWPLASYLPIPMPSFAAGLSGTPGNAFYTSNYSTAFTLVRHQMEFPKGNCLTFYSLYMHLMAHGEYASTPKRKLPAYWPKDLDDSGCDKVTITLDSHGKGIAIKAGELIGHLGCYDSLRLRTSGSRMVHIEVFSDDGIVQFIEQGRKWVNQPGRTSEDWAGLGLTASPTILRVQTQTPLFQNHTLAGQGQNAPVTDVTRVYSLAALQKRKDNPFTEKTTDASAKYKVNWWKVDSADTLRRSIEGWVREFNFPKGKVTREFAQSWIDFLPLDGESDHAHSIFSTTDEWVDYAGGSDAAGLGDRTKLSELMTKVYAALFPKGDGKQAAVDLCTMSKPDGNQYPWLMEAASRLIVKHESEWANPGKWKELIVALEEKSDNKAQYDCEQERIDKLAWWTDVAAGIEEFPTSDVYHLHPIALVANFLSDNCTCANKEISVETVGRITTIASNATIKRFIDGINKSFVDYKFDSCLSRAHFLSQAITESAEFAYTKEQGDHHPYDPWRGRGLIQVTLKENYTAYQKYSGMDVTSSSNAMEKLEKNPDAVLSAAWFFAIRHNLLTASEKDDFIWITRVVNGGFNGYSKRLNYFNRAVEAMEIKGCLKLNNNGVYKFEESAAYNEKRASFAWGLWNDPFLKKEGITTKTNEEAIKGYKRYIELDDAAGRPTDEKGNPLDGGWYLIGEKTKVRTYAEGRLSALGVGK